MAQPTADLPGSPKGLVRFLLMLNGALEIADTQTWTKVGPKGTAHVMANPIEPERLRAFATKWDMSVTEAEKLIADVDTNEQFERWATLVDYLNKGAKAAGVDLETYAEQYLAGAGAHQPGRA